MMAVRPLAFVLMLATQVILGIAIGAGWSGNGPIASPALFLGIVVGVLAVYCNRP